VSIWGTFTGTVKLERSFDDGVTWLVCTKPDLSDANFQLPVTFAVEDETHLWVPSRKGDQLDAVLGHGASAAHVDANPIERQGIVEELRRRARFAIIQPRAAQQVAALADHLVLGIAVYIDLQLLLRFGIELGLPQTITVGVLVLTLVVGCGLFHCQNCRHPIG
jgi:hypothetical protein